MLTKMGSILYRGRISILCITLLLVVGTATYGLGVFGFLSTTDNPPATSDSTQARQLLNAKLHGDITDVIILLSSDTLVVTDPDFIQAANTLLTRFNTRPEVASLTSFYSTYNADFISRDGHEMFALLQLKGQDLTTKENEYNRLKPLLTSQTLQVRLGGNVPFSLATITQLNDDLQQGERLTLPVLAVLLLLVFDGIIAAALPLLIGGLAVLGTLAVLRLLTAVTEVSVYSINVVTMLGLGLAIDYSLFIISRFREELSYNEQDVRTALERTMATAGRTVIFSALTVSISLVSLLLFPLNILYGMGLGAISTILVVMLASITLLPVLLALLGRRVNVLSLRRLIRLRRFSKATNTREQQGVWYRLSETVMRWPIPIALVVILIVLTLGIPFLHIKFATPDANSLPAGQEVRVVGQKLSEDFAHQGHAQITIAITTPGNALSPANLVSLDSYVKSVQATPGVIQVQSLVTVSPDLNLAAYQQLYAHPGLDPQIDQVAATLANDNVTKVIVALQPRDHTSEATALVKHIRALRTPGGLKAQADGATPDEIDKLNGIDSTVPHALLLIIASIFVLLFLMTGSLIMPLKAIILNTLSLSATFGSLVWIFQDGHLQNLLHFESPGSIDATQPVLIFAIAFGLSMDYEVFLLSRIKERFDQTGNNRLAVSSGIQNTGWLITSAALLLVVVLLGFSTAKTIFIQEIGIGLALAVIMDATLIRMLLLPATMRLLGTINWWAPAPLQWLWQHIGLTESGQGPAAAAATSSAFQAPAGAPKDHSVSRRQVLQPLPEPIAHPVDNPTPTSKQLASPLNVISTRTTNGEEVMGPETLLWRYPGNDVVHGSLLVVESNHFCILKLHGTILDVYEAGQYMIKTPENPLIGPTQLGFNGAPIPLKHDALYINRAKLVVKTSGIALTYEMVEVDYNVDYYIHVATREDAVRLVHQMPYQGHTLSIQDINAYTGPVIEEAVSQVLLTTPLKQVRSKVQELSQLVHQHLREFLSTYGITLDTVKVLGLGPHNARTKELITLKACGLDEADSTNNSALVRYGEQRDTLEHTLYMIWQNTLDHYAEEIITLETELENTRANIELSMDLHRTRLHGLSSAITSKLRTSATVLDAPRVPHPGTTHQPGSKSVNGTQQFRTPKPDTKQLQE